MSCRRNPPPSMRSSEGKPLGTVSGAGEAGVMASIRAISASTDPAPFPEPRITGAPP